MAKIFLFSDLHGHPFRSYATILPNGMNSRLADAVKCVEVIYTHAVNMGADLVLFAGDMFHVRKTISVPAFNAIYEQMAKFAVSKIPVVMIHGNHDQADKAGEDYSTYAFNSFLHVVDKSGWITLECAEDSYSIMAVPYTEDVEQLKALADQSCPEDSYRKLFLGHMGIKGAVVGADFVYPGLYDPSITDLVPANYDAVFLGHFHKYQQLASNAWYIGAPLQHNWGDRGDPRGFLIYDTETRTHERVPLPSPQFVEVVDTGSGDWADMFSTCPRDSFVRLVTDRRISERECDGIRSLIEARTLEIEPLHDQATSQRAVRLEVDPTMSVGEMMARYVRSGLSETDGLDDNYLLQLGHEILEEVEESK